MQNLLCEAHQRSSGIGGHGIVVSGVVADEAHMMRRILDRRGHVRVWDGLDLIVEVAMRPDGGFPNWSVETNGPKLFAWTDGGDSLARGLAYPYQNNDGVAYNTEDAASLIYKEDDENPCIRTENVACVAYERILDGEKHEDCYASISGCNQRKRRIEDYGADKVIETGRGQNTDWRIVTPCKATRI